MVTDCNDIALTVTYRRSHNIEGKFVSQVIKSIQKLT